MGIRQRLAHYFSSTPNSRGQLGVLAEQGVVVEHGESLEQYNEKVCTPSPVRYTGQALYANHSHTYKLLVGMHLESHYVCSWEVQCLCATEIGLRAAPS